MGITSGGKIVFNSGTNNAATVATGSAAGDLVSPGIYNDGFWHQVVATHNGTANVLYVDGAPVAANTSSANIPGSAADVLIGADPSFTNNPTQGEGRQFAGGICEVAFFATALTSGQIQALYNASDLEPVITQQPVSAMVNAGIAFTNSLTAIGVGPLSYQWYMNGTAIGGANTNSLAMNPVEPANRRQLLCNCLKWLRLGNQRGCQLDRAERSHPCWSVPDYVFQHSQHELLDTLHWRESDIFHFERRCAANKLFLVYQWHS